MNSESMINLYREYIKSGYNEEQAMTHIRNMDTVSKEFVTHPELRDFLKDFKHEALLKFTEISSKVWHLEIIIAIFGTLAITFFGCILYKIW